MAMIECPECGKEISDKAQSCIGCGAPVGEAPAEATPEVPEKVVTTQATGKMYKGAQAVGVVVILAGIVMMVKGYIDAAIGALIIGLCLFLFGGVGGWWEHE